MKATILDLKKKIIYVKDNEEFTRLFEYNENECTANISDLDSMDLRSMDIVTKIYKRVILAFPKENKRENFYINQEDWEKIIPLIKSIVEDRTKKSLEKIKVQEDIICELDKRLKLLYNKWYVKVGRKIQNIFH